MVYALYEQKEIPLEMLIKAERRLGQLEMDVRLAEHGLTALPQPAPEQPKQETVRDVADWLEASEKGGGEKMCIRDRHTSVRRGGNSARPDAGFSGRSVKGRACHCWK